MKKQILEEIFRVQQLMGVENRKPLIREQLSVLLKLIKTAGSNMDDLIKVVVKGIESGAEVEASKIDDLIEYVKSTGKYTDEEIETLSSFLKKSSTMEHISTGKGLFSKIDDLADDITEQEANVLAKLAKSTDLDIEGMIKKALNKLVSNVSDSPTLNFIESSTVKKLDEILESPTEYIENIDDLYKILDDKIDERFPIPENASDVQKELYGKWRAELKTKIRENANINSKIKELNDAGKIGPRQVTGDIVRVTDDEVDDVVRVADDEADEMEDIFEDPDTYDPDPLNWGPVESSSFRDNFLYGSIQTRWMELIRDTFRSYFGFRNIGTLVDEIPELVSQIERRYDDLTRLGADDVANAKLIKDIEAELDAMITKLKSNMNIAKSAEQTFSQIWEEIKVGIRQTAGEQRGNELISYIGNKGPVESIESYIDLMMKNAKTSSDTYNLLKFWKAGTRSWKESFADLRWKDRYKAYKEAMLQPKGLWEKTKTFISFWMTKPLGRVLNLLSFGTFNLATRIRDLIRMGRFTGSSLTLGGRTIIPNLWLDTIELYIWKTVIVNIVQPFAGLFVNLFVLFFEWVGFEITKNNPELSEQNPFVTLWEDLKGKLTGKTLEMNPYWMPLPLTGGEEGKGDTIYTLGFKQAPIWPVIDGLITFLGGNTKADQVEERRKKVEADYEMAEKKLIDEISKESQKNFNKLPENERLKIINDNDFNIIEGQIIEHNPDKFTKDEIKFLIDRLSFRSGAPGDYFSMLKLTNPEAYKEEMKNASEYIKNTTENPLSVASTPLPKLESNVGDVVITDNSDKQYIVVSYESGSKKIPKNVDLKAKAPNSQNFPEQNKVLFDRAVWIKPSYDELTANSTRTYHNLREFLNLNYKK